MVAATCIRRSIGPWEIRPASTMHNKSVSNSGTAVGACAIGNVSLRPGGYYLKCRRRCEPASPSAQGLSHHSR